MSYANPLWGAPRIHGELLKLGIEISQATVAKYMLRRPRHAIADLAQLPQQRSTRHRRYRDLHRAVCDFPTPVRDAHPSSRPPEDGPLRCHAASDRGLVVAPVTKTFPWDTAPRYLLRDRDASYSEVFSKRVAVMDIAEVVIAPRSPWQNPYVERAIGSIRRECLDHVIVFNERHLRRALSSYFDYYHRYRTHLSLRKDSPEPRPIEPPDHGRVIAFSQVGRWPASSLPATRCLTASISTYHWSRAGRHRMAADPRIAEH